ncbi:pI10L_2 [African swine fever virus]|uniref:PI10L_2 n=1 Tax=African swine fever virus TaxID=10497 RepID=A0A8A1UE33_ASF|nr:pI10L_2 [African swine fever virus]
MQYFSGYCHYSTTVLVFTNRMWICVYKAFSSRCACKLFIFPSYATFWIFCTKRLSGIFICMRGIYPAIFYTRFSKWRLQISSTITILIQLTCIFTCTDVTIYFIIFYVIFCSFYTAHVGTKSTHTVVSFILTVCICLTFFFWWCYWYYWILFRIQKTRYYKNYENTYIQNITYMQNKIHFIIFF